MAIPWNAYGWLSNFWQSAQADRQFQEAIRTQVEPANVYGRQTAESLGPISPTTTMAGQLYGRARGLGEQFSGQEVTDANQRFNQLRESELMGLRSRGIGGSTVAPSVALGVERGRSDELRRLNDARLTRLLGIEETFGGGQIAANQYATDARLRALDMRNLVLPQAPTMFQPTLRG